MAETVTHNVVRQLTYIRQALSQNKKSLGFFIGAGCPLSVRITDPKGNDAGPIIPDVAGLTACIGERLTAPKTQAPSHWDRLVTLLKEDGKRDPNIEDILTAVRALRAVAGKGQVRGFNYAELEELDRHISQNISQLVDKALPTANTPYHNLALWLRGLERVFPVHIFTTNYDLLLEQALEESLAPYFDGFVGTKAAFFDLGAVENESLLPARWTRLWKVHGSINWRLDSNGNVVRSDKVDSDSRYLIYPSHLKYDQSRKMPYLAMLDRLKEFLLKPGSVLFLAGYSFSDEHINDVLCRSLASNSSGMVYAFIYGKIDDAKYANARDCALKSPNLSLVAFDGAIIGRKLGGWYFEEGTQLPDMESILIPPRDTNADEDRQECELRLGDFLQFANLLKSLSGNVRGEHEE
ncbi:SIR2 family NAD-dependent protein deacylase [Gimibacter soli]|uniref:SIR2 family protein n=1 Tax=Gimibacter soli TaxID=3024400 RepID=A0AAE9XPU1_9PROT|nr:SIR2 family protein [Gimibacter soli]WCL52881.1 SIR2 family protein [Gimibacter soli]